MNVEVVSVGGNACLCPQVLMDSNGSESILLAVGNVIQNVTVSSGLLKGTYRSHKDLVNAMCIVNSTSPLVVSSSFDGQIELWNPETFETLHSFHLNRPVIKLISVPFWIEKMDETEDKHNSAKVDYVVALARSSNPEKKSFDILKITISDLLNGKSDGFVFFGSTLTSRLESFAFDTTSNSSNGASLFRTYHALVANGKKGLNFLICAEREGLNSQQSSVYYSMNDPVIAFSSNTSSGSIAVGHDNGQISILTNVAEFLRQFWQYGNKKSGEVLAATHHWHAHPVMSLCFSYDGSLLYSGGEENVLVIWDLKNAGRNYLPRLGAPICRIIAGQSVQRIGHVLITTVDNAVRLVNVANFEVEWMWQSANISTSLNTFQHKHKSVAESSSSAASIVAKAISPEQQRIQLLRSLQPYRFQEDHAERAWFAQCLINPRTGNLLINGNPGILQEFDFYNGIIRQNHPLLQHHRVSRKDPGMRMFLPSITRFAVDASGRLLVTVDVKRGEEQPKEYSLKIWEWFADNERESGEYRIVAQLDKPHGDYPVTSLGVSQIAAVSSGLSNDQVLQSVMIATGSNDGTVKLWTRKAMEEVSDIYTSAGTANSDAQENTKSNSSISNNNNNNNTKKQYALHKLRWKCHYAFTYRLAPVLAVTFSLDSSLLIVAHDNLITCWDPQSVALRASLTLSIPRKITYLSVIEPRAASDYGQGVGDVYLVAGTNVSVSVFSLLSLQELWSVDGLDIESISTASNESFAWSSRVDSLHQYRFQSTVADEGWIAIASSTISPTTNSEGQSATAPHHSVMIYSPISAKPLLREHVSFSSKITSLAFLRRQVASASGTAVMGLAALSADSDVCIVQPSQHPCSFQPGVTALVGDKAASTLATSSARTTTTPTAVALVKAPKLPTVMFNAEASVRVESARDLSARMVAPIKAAAPMGRALASKDWLRSLLPENTEDLPKISDIAGSYLRSMLDNSVPSTGKSASTATSSPFSATEPKSEVSTQSSSAASVAIAPKVGAVASFPSQDTDELLRRVSAKWISALGKRSHSTVGNHATSQDSGEKTPRKKSKKDKDTNADATPKSDGEHIEKPKEKAPKTPSKKSASAAVIENLPPLPENEEVSIAVTEAVASHTTRAPSTRKRRGSEVSTESSVNETMEEDAKVAPRRTSSRKSVGKKTAGAEEENDDDISDAASTATDATTTSVASARRSARHMTNSLLAMAPAPATVAVAAESSRSTRSRK